VAALLLARRVRSDGARRGCDRGYDGDSFAHAGEAVAVGAGVRVGGEAALDGCVEVIAALRVPLTAP
jgi:hypothetical protein